MTKNKERERERDLFVYLGFIQPNALCPPSDPRYQSEYEERFLKRLEIKLNSQSLRKQVPMRIFEVVLDVAHQNFVFDIIQIRSLIDLEECVVTFVSYSWKYQPKVRVYFGGKKVIFTNGFWFYHDLLV